MSPSSCTPDERARKATSLILQRLSPDGTQRNLAQAWGVSESTVSRMKEQVEPVMRMVAQLGLKIVSAERVCVTEGELRMLRAAYARVSEQAPWLLNEGES